MLRFFFSRLDHVVYVQTSRSPTYKGASQRNRLYLSPLWNAPRAVLEEQTTNIESAEKIPLAGGQAGGQSYVDVSAIYLANF